jgi:hypothetical protein
MTREQWENKVIDQVRENGGFSIFWVTQNQFIANAADRLVASGRMVVMPKKFPWSDAKIVRKRKRARKK